MTYVFDALGVVMVLAIALTWWLSPLEDCADGDDVVE